MKQFFPDGFEKKEGTMSKPFLVLMSLFIGLIAGILVSASLVEYEFKKFNRVIDEAIVLQLPKDEGELSKQLLYLSASKGMLEEIQRQKVAKKK
jgi:hypothetical protein